MGRLGLAFKILFNGEVAQLAAAALAGEVPKAIEQTSPEPVAPPVIRSEAVTLLAAMQRDARFVDFIQEKIDGYSDAQVGAAVRDVHRGCGDVLERMFAPKPVVDQPEDSQVEVSNPAAAQWRLTGNVGQLFGPVTGKLMHSGWKTSKCQVPDWNGSAADANVIAPAEVETS